MGNLFDNLYKKFFMRDIFSIFISGYLMFISIIKLSEFELVSIPVIVKMMIFNNSQKELSVLAVITVIGISYSIGLLVNCIRDFICFRIIYSEFGCDYFVKYLEIKDTYYMNTKEKQWIEAERERIVAMIHISGNLSISLFIAGIAFRDVVNCLGFVLIILLSLFLLVFSICKFRDLKKMMEKYQ